MSTFRATTEGRSEVRIQATERHIILGIETPLQTGILHMAFTTMLTLEDATTLHEMLSSAIYELMIKKGEE